MIIMNVPGYADTFGDILNAIATKKISKIGLAISDIIVWFLNFVNEKIILKRH